MVYILSCGKASPKNSWKLRKTLRILKNIPLRGKYECKQGVKKKYANVSTVVDNNEDVINGSCKAKSLKKALKAVFERSNLGGIH